eukprot:1086287-Pelagomonas_calceolata.AAC.4
MFIECASEQCDIISFASEPARLQEREPYNRHMIGEVRVRITLALLTSSFEVLFQNSARAGTHTNLAAARIGVI